MINNYFLLSVGALECAGGIQYIIQGNTKFGILWLLAGIASFIWSTVK